MSGVVCVGEKTGKEKGLGGKDERKGKNGSFPRKKMTDSRKRKRDKKEGKG